MESPTTWNIKYYRDLKVSSDGLSIKQIDSNTFRANYPIPQQCGLFYFEVDIIDKGKYGAIIIGFCTKKAAIYKSAGEQDSSWGYRGDDGKVYYANIGKSYGPGFKTGDTIGCCLNFRNNKVFYTINGVNLGIAFRYLKSSLYPCVRIESQDGEIKVNFGHKKFKYTAMNDEDIKGFLKEKWADILNPFNKELISQQIEGLSDIKSLETEHNVTHILNYRAKFYLIIGEYEKALADCIKLLEFESNNAFALRYRGETYNLMGRCEESLADLIKLLEINANDTWALKAMARNRIINDINGKEYFYLNNDKENITSLTYFKINIYVD